MAFIKTVRVFSHDTNTESIMDEMKSRQETSDDGVGGVGGADITTTVLESEQSVELVVSGL